ncbi:MAG: 50S ribosomal protein L25 [Holophagales bacterium]|jgi:large subunit ribosomal protein L25|nr:50S ribosomal protein L25 [Holophagales bacterium]
MGQVGGYVEEAILIGLRLETGKSANRKLRREGMIPATVYGLGEAPVSLKISPKIVSRVLSSETGMNSLIYLQREGTDIKRHVIIKELQRNPVTGRLIHVDFMRVDPRRKVRVRVPIRLLGTPVGAKEGGMLEFVHREAEIECLPGAIPAHVDVDVTPLKIGDNMRLDQVKLPEDVELLDAPQSVICIVHGKKAEETQAAEQPAAEEGASTT